MSLARRVDAAVREAIGRGELPGAVVLVARDGRKLLHRAWGQAQVRPVRIPMRTDTVFDLASLTKPLATALSLMTLAEDGRIAWRDRVSRHLPRFTGGGKERVTLLDLATHTGGLDDRGLYDHARPMVTTARARDLLWDKELFAPPGTAYLYADLNYIALGWVVEAAAGMPLDAWFARRVARPLGLKDTGFRPPARQQARCAATADGVARGVVHDPRARDLGGVAGHAGLFGTAAEVWAITQAILDGGVRRGKRILSPAGCAAMTAVQSPAGLRPRMIGWDSDPDGVGPRGDFFPAGGFGHTGFTGTSVWSDPASRTVVVILTNRVHPDGKGNADPLRRRVANLVAASLPVSRTVPRGTVQSARGMSRRVQVLTGADVLAADGFKALAGKRIGLVTNLSVLNRGGKTTLDLLAAAPGITLAALFTPEHGLEAKVEEKISSGRHGRLKIPVHSLYGETFKPKPAWLEGLDALVVDLPDIGVRFYTYHATLGYCLEAAAAARIEVIVLDRPNPVTGLRVEGPLLPKDRWGFTGYTALPVVHGLTLGELGRFMNGEHKIGARLSVVTMQGWRRALWFDETGLPWANPSPNIRTLTQAILYPAVGLLEPTTVSVGRGTDAPFERFGAPWLDGERVARELNARRLPGVRFHPASFTPTASVHANATCRGVALSLTDRDAFRPVLTGLTLADVVVRVHPDFFFLPALDRLLGCLPARKALADLVPPPVVSSGWEADELGFENLRRRYLLY